MWYTEFFEDTQKTIRKALDFTLEKSSTFYRTRRILTNSAHHDLINKDEEEIKKKIQNATSFLNTARGPYAMDEKIHQYYMNIIKSALEIYLDDLTIQSKNSGIQSFDAQIVEVRRVLDLDPMKKTESKFFDKFYEKQPKVEAKQLEAFISYAQDGKQIGTIIKKKFESSGVLAFMAHRDIAPSKEWREEIFTHLNSCDLFIALVTSAFIQSPYSNQEVGMALGKGKRIFPIAISEERAGFLEIKQEIRLKGTSDEEIDSVVKKILGNLIK